MIWGLRDLDNAFTMAEPFIFILRLDLGVTLSFACTDPLRWFQVVPRFPLFTGLSLC